MVLNESLLNTLRFAYLEYLSAFRPEEQVAPRLGTGVPGSSAFLAVDSPAGFRFPAARAKAAASSSHDVRCTPQFVQYQCIFAFPEVLFVYQEAPGNMLHA